jgi:hypothetical protein
MLVVQGTVEIFRQVRDLAEPGATNAYQDRKME